MPAKLAQSLLSRNNYGSINGDADTRVVPIPKKSASTFPFLSPDLINHIASFLVGEDKKDERDKKYKELLNAIIRWAATPMKLPLTFPCEISYLQAFMNFASFTRTNGLIRTTLEKEYTEVPSNAIAQINFLPRVVSRFSNHGVRQFYYVAPSVIPRISVWRYIGPFLPLVTDRGFAEGYPAYYGARQLLETFSIKMRYDSPHRTCLTKMLLFCIVVTAGSVFSLTYPAIMPETIFTDCANTTTAALRNNYNSIITQLLTDYCVVAASCAASANMTNVTNLILNLTHNVTAASDLLNAMKSLCSSAINLWRLTGMANPFDGYVRRQADHQDIFALYPDSYVFPAILICIVSMCAMAGIMISCFSQMLNLSLNGKNGEELVPTATVVERGLFQTHTKKDAVAATSAAAPTTLRS